MAMEMDDAHDGWLMEYLDEGGCGDGVKSCICIWITTMMKI